jgi:hypothetical protein
VMTPHQESELRYDVEHGLQNHAVAFVSELEARGIMDFALWWNAHHKSKITDAEVGQYLRARTSINPHCGLAATLGKLIEKK